MFLAGCAAQEEGWQLRSFEKYEGNPIITPQGATWEAKDVFNPAAWVEGDTVKLLYRAEDSTGIGDWNGTSRIGLATSTDGIHFDRDSEPVLEPTEPWELPGGTEDPRLVKIDDTFYLTYTAYDGDTNIWAATSTDGIHWTAIEEPVLRPREGHFDSRLVEPGPTPVMTDDGILLVYNGADEELVYGVGQALIDPNDPTHVIARSAAPFLTPTTDLEQHGQISNVVFAEGLVQLDGTWFLYYGMGDSGIGVATLTAETD